MNNLAVGYRVAGKVNLALPLYEETLQRSKAKLGRDHPNTLASMGNLERSYRAVGKLDLALPLQKETLELTMAKFGADHPSTLTGMANLGGAYCDAKQGEKAATVLRQYIAARRKRSPKDDPRFPGVLAQVSLDLLKCNQFATAEEMFCECLSIREKAQPDAWSTFNAHSLLDEALLRQKKYTDAEPLLLEGYEGMKRQNRATQRRTSGNPRIA